MKVGRLWARMASRQRNGAGRGDRDFDAAAEVRSVCVAQLVGGDCVGRGLRHEADASATQRPFARYALNALPVARNRPSGV